MDAAFRGEFPSVCRSSSISLLDLSRCRCQLYEELERGGKRMVRAGDWCGASFYGRSEVARLVQIQLSPERTVVRGGGAIEFQLSFTTCGHEPVPIVLQLRQGALVSLRTLRDGEPVKFAGPCWIGASAADYQAVVLLEPRQPAQATIEWSATDFTGPPNSNGCVEKQPLAPGTYTVRPAFEVFDMADVMDHVSATVAVTG